MLHTKLPIYERGYKLLLLAASVQLNMPRTFKQTLGKRIHDECVEILLEIGYANASRGEDRCTYIRSVLRRLEVISVTLRVSFDSQLIAPKVWSKGIEIIGHIGDQAGGWLKKSTTAPVPLGASL